MRKLLILSALSLLATASAATVTVTDPAALAAEGLTVTSTATGIQVCAVPGTPPYSGKYRIRFDDGAFGSASQRGFNLPTPWYSCQKWRVREPVTVEVYQFPALPADWNNLAQRSDYIGKMNDPFVPAVRALP